MLSLISAEKSFDDPWIGHPELNGFAGLHRHRMALAEAMTRARCRLAGRPEAAEAYAGPLGSLARDGVALVTDALPGDMFERLCAEAEAALGAEACASRAAMAPVAMPAAMPARAGRGGALAAALLPEDTAMPHGDRHLSHRADPATAPLAAAALALPLVRALAQDTLGQPRVVAAPALHLALAGGAEEAPLLDWAMHRDSFCRGLKLWLTLTPVGEAEGPLVYLAGSHRLTRRRLAWEQSVATRLSTLRGPALSKAGRFRIGEAEIAALGYDERDRRVLSCPANTLIAINTLGFHARLPARPGTERLAVEGRIAPNPFALRAS
ncbi:MAG: phytanoyl-CoA dioxygenase family protein [Pseudomonadota bacterium]